MISEGKTYAEIGRIVGCSNKKESPQCPTLRSSPWFDKAF